MKKQYSFRIQQNLEMSIYPSLSRSRKTQQQYLRANTQIYTMMINFRFISSLFSYLKCIFQKIMNFIHQWQCYECLLDQQSKSKFDRRYKYFLNYLNQSAIMGQCCDNEASQEQSLDPQLDKKLDLPSINLRRFHSVPPESQQSLMKPKKRLARQNSYDIQAVTLRLSQLKRKEEQWLNQTAKQLAVLEQKQQQEFVDFREFIYAYQKLSNFYEMHDLDSSFATIKELQTLKIQIMSVRAFSDQQFMKQLKTIEQQWQKDSPGEIIHPYNLDKIRKIEEEMKNLKFYEDLLNREPFIEKYNKNGIKISMRTQGSTIGAQLQTDLQVPFEQFAMLLTEVNYFSDFIPFCEHSKMLKDEIRNEKVGYARFNFPIVSRREGFFKGTSYFRFKATGEVFIYIRSLEKQELEKEHIDAKFNEDYVKLRFNYFVITYRPLQEGVGRLKFSFCIDNGINFMPSFIEEMVTKKVGKELFQKLLEFSNDFEGSKWQKAMEANPEFAVFVRQRIAERLSQPKQSQNKYS